MENEGTGRDGDSDERKERKKSREVRMSSGRPRWKTKDKRTRQGVKAKSVVQSLMQMNERRGQGWTLGKESEGAGASQGKGERVK